MADETQLEPRHGAGSAFERISRRRFVQASALGAAGMAALLAACGQAPATVAPAAPTSAPTPAGPAPSPTEVPRSFGAPTPTTAAASAASPVASPAAQPTKAGNLADKQLFRFADGEPPTFDPGVASSPYNTSQVFEGLITINQTDGTFDAAMAESYSANADATVWTFKLRSGLKWSDGTPLTAKDFEYSFKRVMDPKTASKYTSALYVIKNGIEVTKGQVPPDQLGVKAVDEKTFEVTLNTPIPFFPLIASTWTCYPVPKHVIDKVGDKWVEAANIVTNGPWVLKEWKHDQLQAFERNPNYWGKQPALTRVECTLYDDTAKQLAAYENGELDTAVVSAADYDRARNDAKLSKEMKGFAASSTLMLHLDCTNKPTSDVRVRQALALGYDHDTLINVVLKKYFLPAPTVLPQDIPGYNEKAALTGGIEKGRQLLAEAGFANGQGFPADFSIVYPANSTYKLLLEYLQQEWKKNLGINVQLQSLELKAYIEWRVARKTQPYNGHLGIWGSDYGDPNNWHNQLFHSNADFYNTHWKNEEFDTIITNAKGMTDKVKRVEEYQKAETILVRDSAHIPIYHGQSFYVIKPNVQGIYHRPILGTIPWFKYISITK